MTVTWCEENLTSSSLNVLEAYYIFGYWFLGTVALYKEQKHIMKYFLEKNSVRQKQAWVANCRKLSKWRTGAWTLELCYELPYLTYPKVSLRFWLDREHEWTLGTRLASWSAADPDHHHPHCSCSAFLVGHGGMVSFQPCTPLAPPHSMLFLL